MPFGDAALATIISAAIAGLVGWATNRNSAKTTKAAAQVAAESAVQNQTIASRTEIETLAFERAKGYYTDTIDRQDREIHEQAEEIAGLKTRVRDLEDEVHTLRDELDVARQALRLKYPDE